MTLAWSVLQIVAPVFALAAIGFAWVRLGFDYDTAFVTRLAMTLAVPCLIFAALARSEIDAQAAGRIALAALAAYLAVAAAAWALCRAKGLPMRTYLAPLTFGNTGNLGLPLALLAFGPTGLAYAVVVFATGAMLQFTFGLWVVAGGGAVGRALREPLVGATLAGGLFLWRGWTVPDVAFDVVSLLGQMAIPLMLITLGVAMARIRASGLASLAGLAAIKAVGCAGLAWLVGRAFALDGQALGVLVVQLATPVAVTSYLLAAKYGADAAPVAGLVVASTALSVAVLPAILAVLL